jgi:ABC-type lipoprotein export system ATPase subunit
VRRQRRSAVGTRRRLAARAAAARPRAARRRGPCGARRRSPAELSGGEQQRVAACAALVHQPALLLADEPAGELDAGTARTVYRLLAELVAQVGTTLVIVSHDRGRDGAADRVVQVRDGRISGEVLRGGLRGSS